MDRRKKVEIAKITLTQAQPLQADQAKRWTPSLYGKLLEDARGALVLYQDYRRVRLAHNRLADKLRQMSVLYRKALAQNEVLQRELEARRPKPIENNAAELAALRKLAVIVGRRVGDNPEILAALRSCAAAQSKASH